MYNEKNYMFQLDLQFLNNKDTLRDYFEKVTGKSVSLTITDNSTSLLSLRTKSTSVSVRLHWMFLHADIHVIREIAAFIKNGKTKTPFISEYIRKNDACLKNKPAKKHRSFVLKAGITICTSFLFQSMMSISTVLSRP